MNKHERFPDELFVPRSLAADFLKQLMPLFLFFNKLSGSITTVTSRCLRCCWYESVSQKEKPKRIDCSHMCSDEAGPSTDGCCTVVERRETWNDNNSPCCISWAWGRSSRSGGLSEPVFCRHERRFFSEWSKRLSAQDPDCSSSQDAALCCNQVEENTFIYSLIQHEMFVDLLFQKYSMDSVFVPAVHAAYRWDMEWQVPGGTGVTLASPPGLNILIKKVSRGHHQYLQSTNRKNQNLCCSKI